MASPEDKPEGSGEQKAGYLILRLKLREGFTIGEEGEHMVEVRLACVETKRGAEAQIAVRAPRQFKIRRVK